MEESQIEKKGESAKRLRTSEKFTSSERRAITESENDSLTALTNITKKNSPEKKWGGVWWEEGGGSKGGETERNGMIR